MFRLALALGFPHPDYLEKILTSKQVGEWMAFAALEPFGERNRDLSVAILTAQFSNANRDTNKRPSPFTPFDFMPDSIESKLIKEQKQSTEKQSEAGIGIFKLLRDHLRKRKEKR